MGKLLCLLGIHDWWNIKTTHYGNRADRYYVCLRCNKKKVKHNE